MTLTPGWSTNSIISLESPSLLASHLTEVVVERFSHRQWISNYTLVINQKNLWLFLSFAWQQGSQFIPKLTMMVSVCRCLQAKRLQPFSFQGCDLVSLFVKQRNKVTSCWVLCMFLKLSITTWNFALNLWSYPGQLITSDPFFSLLVRVCPTPYCTT